LLHFNMHFVKIKLYGVKKAKKNSTFLIENI